MIYGRNMRKVRHYVRVVALHELDGQMIPLEILWDGYQRFDVQMVGHPRRERATTHGFALRHDVMVRGQRRVLWRDAQGWFVEVPECPPEEYGVGHGFDPREADIPC